MLDTTERRIIWSIILLVGVAICVFAISGSTRLEALQLAFLPLGIVVIAFAVYRIRAHDD